MNKTELAKLLIKHPEIKALYESRAFDASTINKVIAEEIVREQDEEDPIEAAFGKKLQNMSDDEKKEAIMSLRLSRSGLQKTLKSIMDDIREFGEDEELTQELADTRVRAREITTLMKKIKDSTDKAVAAALKTPETEDDKVVTAATNAVADAAVKAAMAAAEVREPLETIKTSQDQEQVSAAISSIDAAIAKALEKSQSAAEAAEKTASAATTASDEIVDDEGGSNDSSNDDSSEDSDGSAGIPEKAEQLIVKNISEEATVSNFPILLSDREFVENLLRIPQISGQNSTKGGIFGEPEEQTGDVGGLSENKGSSDPVGLMKEIERFRELLEKPSNGDFYVSGLQRFEGLLFTDNIRSILQTASGEEAIQIKQKQIDELEADNNPFNDDSFLEKLKEELKQIEERTQQTSDTTEDGEDALVDQTISSVVQDVSAVDVAKTIGTLALDVGKNLLPSGIKNSLQTGLDFLNDQELWLKAAESAVKGDYDGSAEIVATELVEKVQERFELNSLKDGPLKTITIAAMKPALSTGIKLAVESGADNVIDGAKELYSDAKEKIEQAFTPSEEGTQEAIEAIEDGVPENVEDIQPADIQAAEEQLESEIEASEEMQANAQELETKVEKNKMATKSAAKSAWDNFKSSLNKSNVEQKNELLKQAAEQRLRAYDSARSWEDLSKSPLGHRVPPEATAESFQDWKDNSLPEIKNYFEGVLKRADKVEPEEIEAVADDIGTKIQTIDDAISNDANNDAGERVDASGAEVGGQTDLETIKKILPQLKDMAPNLFKFDGFVKNLAQALMNAEPSSVASDADGEGVDASGTANSSDTNLASNISSNEKPVMTGDSQDPLKNSEDKNLEEALSGIYLAEEEDVVDDTDEAGDEKTGKPLEVADAETLKKELEALRDALVPKNINVDDLLTPELKQALGQEPTEETSEVPTVEEATEEGQNAAQDDAELRDARYQDLYAGFKEQMDTFFSLDGKNDGFMDQFLLKYQAAKLAELIGNLDLIIGGGTGGKDDEGEARALSTATQQADDNLNEAQEQEISEKGQIELKTRLVAMLKGLKSLKAMMNSYKQNATRSSANPKLDGSALKKSLQRYMSNLQMNIKAIVETCYIEHSKLTQTQSDDVDLNEPSGDEATPPTGDDTNQNVEDPQPSAQNEQLYEAILEAIAPALDGVYLMEDAAREEKMEIVNTIYGQMKEEIYLPSMQSALEQAQKETAMKNASQMMELAKKEEFVALFPTFVGSFGGKPQTIDQAVDAIDGLLKEFIETMKKVIVLAKGATIDETTLAKVIEDLSMMSLMMQNYFGVKSLLDDDMQARVEKMLAQREENQSLSDEAKPSNERSGGGLIKKGLDKLKQAFQWISEKTLVFLMKHFGGDSKFFKQLQDSDLEQEQKEELVEDVKESIGFLQSLEQKQVDAINKLFIDMGKRGAQLAEEVFKFSNVRDFEVEFSKNFDQKIKEILFISMNKGLEEEERSLVVDLMRSRQNEFVSFMTSFFKVKGKLGNEASEELINATLDAADDLRKRSGLDDSSDPATNDLDASDDDDLNDIPEPERLSSEKEMKKLINILSDSSDTKIKKVIARSKTMFEDNSERMLSLMVYYMLANSNQLRENISEQPVRPPRDAEGTNTIKKINTFLNEILKQTRLSTQIKDFIKGSRSKIVNFLKSKDVENLVQDYATGKSPLLGKLKRLVDKSIETKKIVGLETEDTTTDSDDVMSAEVEFDDEDETNDSSQEDEQDNLRAAQTSRQEWKNLGPEGLKRELSRLGASVNPDAQEDLQDAIESLSELFFDIKQAVVETKDSYSMQFDEGIKDSFKSIKGKVKSSANKFMSRFDLPKELKDDLKYLENNPSNTSGPELAERYKSNAIKFITNLKNTGVKFSGGLDVFLWTLYLNYGNIDETAKNIKVTNQNRREMDLRSQFGSEIDESNKTSRLEESLKPIIEKMLKERYNY